MERTTPIHKVNKKAADAEPFVSVLTPVYNGEEFLRECIESVLKQSYDNWEYVLVNNQSTDDSLQIMKEYAAKDERIRIHNNEDFLPQMENLNHAFRQISPKSKYCKVVHADDMILPGCITKMVAVAEKYPSIGIVSSYRLDNEQVLHNGLPYPSEYNDGREISRNFLLGKSNYFGSPTSLLLRSILIFEKDKVYDESYLESDWSACLDMLRNSDFGFVHQVLTYTRRHSGSMTERVVKKLSTDIVGYLKIHLDYGHFFLNGEELQHHKQRCLRIFYIKFAREILTRRSSAIYVRIKKELENHQIPFRRMKLLKRLFIEMVRLPIKTFLENIGFIR